MLYTITGLIIWTILSIWYVVVTLGDKTRKVHGWRKVAEWILSPPMLLIASVWGYVSWRKRKGKLPVVVANFSNSNRLKNYQTQIRINDEYGLPWIINQYSDQPIVIQIIDKHHKIYKF